MKRPKLCHVFLIFIVLLPLFFLSTPVKAASTDQVQITLHKLLFDYGTLPNDTVNNGSDNPFLTDFTGLNGVTFQVEDVSGGYYTHLSEGATPSEAQKLVASETGEVIIEKVTQTINGKIGLATFSLPKKDTSGRDAVYRFVETAAPEELVNKKADPLVVVLPVYNENNLPLTDIHLYPKNEEIQYTDPPFEKEILHGKNSYEAGDVIPFLITTDIPSDVGDYENYLIKDTADSGLYFNSDSLKITLDENEITDFTLEKEDHGFTVHLTPSSLKNYLGKTLSISYTMTLQGDLLEENYLNEGILYLGDHEEIHSSVTVHSGGKNFQKVDLHNENILLPGAQFVIKNSDDKYLKKLEGKNTWITSNNFKQDDLTFLTSNKDGIFSITGLSYGKYQLIEVVAPDNYILSETPVDFTVEKGSLTGKNNVSLKVVNEKETTPPGKTEDINPPDSSGLIDDIITGTLPQTGEGKIFWSKIFGIIFVLIGLIFLIVKHKKEENMEEKK